MFLAKNAKAFVESFDIVDVQLLVTFPTIRSQAVNLNSVMTLGLEKWCFYDQNGEKFRKEFTSFFDYYIKNENCYGREFGENIITYTVCFSV